MVRRGQVLSGEPSTAMPREDKQSMGMAGKVSWAASSELNLEAKWELGKSGRAE